MKEERLAEIKSLISNLKQITISDLCERLNVSIETIRRDLTLLQSEGFIRKVYGGAVLNENNNISPAMQDWNIRVSQNIKEKQAIAKAVLDYIPDKCTLGLDSGTTIYTIAQHLGKKKDLTILTNSLHIARELGLKTSHQINCIGGSLKSRELINVGLLANSFLDHFARIDIALVSTDGFSFNSAFSDYDIEMAELKKNMIRKAKMTIMALTNTKFEYDSLFSTCDFKDIDFLITDSKVPEHYINRLRDYINKVVVAEV